MLVNIDRKALSFGDRKRLKILEDVYYTSKANFIDITEALAVAYTHVPNSKENYLEYEKWLRNKIYMEKKLHRYAYWYNIAIVKLKAFEEVINDERRKEIL